MRVIAGTARGRPLRAPLPKGVRPTTDRVKESIFDILGSLGGVEDLEVADLFCGSGGLGIEALSRGAASVLFVDADRGSLDAAKSNLAAVGLDDGRANFVLQRIGTWLPPAVDLVLMDPPYDQLALEPLVARLDAPRCVVESAQPLDEIPSWATTRERRYGTTLVTVLDRIDDQDPDA
jgi:16S rRNA (guanine966-N2)-methyltransferase